MRTDLKTTPQLTSNHGGALGVPTAPTGQKDQLVQKVQLTGASCPAELERQRERQKGNRKKEEKTKEARKRKTTARKEREGQKKETS